MQHKELQQILVLPSLGDMFYQLYNLNTYLKLLLSSYSLLRPRSSYHGYWMYILCTILISLLPFPIVKCVCIPRCFAQNRCLLVLEMPFDLLFRVYQNFLLVTPKYIWVNKLAIVVQPGTWTLMNNHQCWWTTIRWKQQTRRDRSLHRCDLWVRSLSCIHSGWGAMQNTECNMALDPEELRD